MDTSPPRTLTPSLTNTMPDASLYPSISEVAAGTRHLDLPVGPRLSLRPMAPIVSASHSTISATILRGQTPLRSSANAKKIANTNFNSAGLRTKNQKVMQNRSGPMGSP